MLLIQKYIFVLFVCLNMANYARHEEYEKVFSDAMIDKFQGNICCALSNKEDIKACAKFKEYMAQELKQASESRKPVKDGAVIAGCIGAAGINAVIYLFISKVCGRTPDVTSKFFWVSELLWGIAGGYGSYRLINGKNNNLIQYNGQSFEDYFKKLAENPLCGNEAIEKEFNELM